MEATEFDQYIDEKCDMIMRRAYSMEQYSSTQEAKEAIKRQLRQVYDAGRLNGITMSPVKKRYLSMHLKKNLAKI